MTTKISRNTYIYLQKCILFHTRTNFVKHFLSPLKGRVLDVGNLGDGGVTIEIRKIVEASGGEYTGLDVNENLAKEMNLKNQYFGDLHDLSGVIESGTFDVVYIGEVIEHSWHPGQMISECARILKEGGTLIMDTPNVYDLKNVLNVFFQKKNTMGDVQELTLEESIDNFKAYRTVQKAIESQPEHKIFYSPASLRQLLNMHGFAVEQIAYIDKATRWWHKLFVKLVPTSAQKIGVVARKKSDVIKIFTEKQFGDPV